MCFYVIFIVGPTVLPSDVTNNKPTTSHLRSSTTPPPSYSRHGNHFFWAPSASKYNPIGDKSPNLATARLYT